MKNWVKPLTIATILSGWALGIGVVEAIALPARIHAIQGQGKVKLQRQNRTSWDLIGVGKDIREGDQIYPESKMKVWVRCPNQKDPVRVKAGVPSGIRSICINWIARNVRGSGLDLATLGGYDPSLPYLIAPRHTLLLNPNPLIRWNAVPGTVEYTLEVKTPKGMVWQIKTKDNKILYGGPALEAGTPYTVLISTNTGKSSIEEKNPDGKDKTRHLEFRLLRPAEIPTLAKTKSTTIADILSLVDIYADYTIPESILPSYELPRDYAETYTLAGEAIALLESIIQKGQSTPLIYRTLGDLYWQTGLIHPAEVAYKKAIALAKTPESLEDATLAQEQLGQIYWVMDKKTEAQQAYLKAKEGYQTLGDNSKVKELQTQLEHIKI
jgi:tetratricopeptide (TPR) repeat protein